MCRLRNRGHDNRHSKQSSLLLQHTMSFSSHSCRLRPVEMQTSYGDRRLRDLSRYCQIFHQREVFECHQRENGTGGLFHELWPKSDLIRSNLPLAESTPTNNHESCPLPQLRQCRASLKYFAFFNKKNAQLCYAKVDFYNKTFPIFIWWFCVYLYCVATLYRHGHR